MRKLIPVVLVALLAGCGEKRIDGTSEESLQVSYERVCDTLEGKEKERFEEAFRAIGVATLRGQTDEAAATRQLLDRLDGKTADEIIAEGEGLTRDTQGG